MLVKKPCGSMKITSQRNSEMYVSFLLTGILLIRRLSDGYVISADSRYSKWIGNTVPYVIAPGYSKSISSPSQKEAPQKILRLLPMSLCL